MIDHLSLDTAATKKPRRPTIIDLDDVGATPPAPSVLNLDDAALVDEHRRTSAMTNLYEALLYSLPADDQQWVLDVVARHRQAEREAEARGETLAGPAW